MPFRAVGLGIERRSAGGHFDSKGSTQSRSREGTQRRHNPGGGRDDPESRHRSAYHDGRGGSERGESSILILVYVQLELKRGGKGKMVVLFEALLAVGKPLHTSLL